MSRPPSPPRRWATPLLLALLLAPGCAAPGGALQDDDDDATPDDDDVSDDDDDATPDDDDATPDDDDDVACDDGELRPGTTPCGPNGKGLLEQVCSGGEWEDTATCLDDDVCTDGQTRDGTVVCFVTGLLQQECSGGQWVDTLDCAGGTDGEYPGWNPIDACWPAHTATFQEGVDGYSGSRDTFVDQGDPSAEHGDDEELEVDRNDDDDQVQSLLAFDGLFGPGLGQLPVGVAVARARLTLQTTNGTSDNVHGHTMLVPWSESDTWSSLGDGITPDHSEAHEAAQALIFAPVADQAAVVDVTSSVAGWALEPADNHGWALLGVDDDGWDWRSSEASDASDRPLLTLVAGDCEPPADPDLTPQTCPDPWSVAYDPGSDLPLVQSNPNAEFALFLDFDGGEYHSHSSGDYEPYGPYNPEGSDATFSAQEQADILGCWEYVRRYYAMFDVNVTTDLSALDAATAWGWQLISDDVSGGRGGLSYGVIGTEMTAHSYAGSSTVTGSDRCRRVAHEFGHNLQLEHNGVWDGDDFYKWEDWPAWDGVYGTIMGGGGEGQRNGWGYDHHSDDPVPIQDSMEVIRQRIAHEVPSSSGWSVDDFGAATPSALCDGGDHLYRQAVLNHPGDVDRFGWVWEGGDVSLSGLIPEVSAALLDVGLYDSDGTWIGGEGDHPALPAGTYEIVVQSQGGYGELGEYEIRVD